MMPKKVEVHYRNLHTEVHEHRRPHIVVWWHDLLPFLRLPQQQHHQQLFVRDDDYFVYCVFYDDDNWLDDGLSCFLDDDLSRGLFWLQPE